VLARLLPRALRGAAPQNATCGHRGGARPAHRRQRLPEEPRWCPPRPSAALRPRSRHLLGPEPRMPGPQQPRAPAPAPGPSPRPRGGTACSQPWGGSQRSPCPPARGSLRGGPPGQQGLRKGALGTTTAPNHGITQGTEHREQREAPTRSVHGSEPTHTSHLQVIHASVLKRSASPLCPHAHSKAVPEGRSHYANPRGVLRSSVYQCAPGALSANPAPQNACLRLLTDRAGSRRWTPPGTARGHRGGLSSTGGTTSRARRNPGEQCSRGRASAGRQATHSEQGKASKRGEELGEGCERLQPGASSHSWARRPRPPGQGTQLRPGTTSAPAAADPTAHVGPMAAPTGARATVTPPDCSADRAQPRHSPGTAPARPTSGPTLSTAAPRHPSAAREAPFREAPGFSPLRCDGRRRSRL